MLLLPYHCIKSISMKSCFLLFSVLLLASTGYGQLKIGLPDKQKDDVFSKSISTVLKDVPYNFRNISGKLELAQAEIEQYASRVQLPGAESCLITRYHSVRDTTASWQAIMARYEDFDQASKAYHQLYKQLNGTNVALIDGSPFYLKGKFEAASEELDFVTSTLKLQTADQRFQKVKVEIALQYKMPVWIVQVYVGSKEDDDKVKPDWMSSE
jgi:hypothetical protein